MSTAAMTAEQAREWLAYSSGVARSSKTADAIEAVLVRLADLERERGAVADQQFGLRLHGEDYSSFGELSARQVADLNQGALIVRDVRYGPWTAVQW